MTDDDDFFTEAPTAGCAMGFCPRDGEQLVAAFGDPEPRLYCSEHAELASAYLDPATEHEDADDGD